MKVFINIEGISKVLGVLWMIIGILLLGCFLFSVVIEDGAHQPLLKSSLICIASGALCWWYKFGFHTSLSKRDGYIIVVLSWFSVSAFGMLPFYFGDMTHSIANAFFESVSGFTTTGASILSDIESVQPSLLLWRSLTQWLGGMGIVVLTVALFPLLGFAGTELFGAEAPGPVSDKIHPRIKDTAQTLWFLYIGLTIALAILLYFEGMTLFDAINHSMTAMATGGFSTKNASIAFYTSPAIQYTLTVFMILAGTNFTMIYFFFRGRWHNIFYNEEWRMYMIVILISTILITGRLVYHGYYGVEESFRAVVFSVVSLITTTGFVTYDYTVWGPAILMFSFMLLFIGGCAGSTGGGIKITRHLVFMRNSIWEFKRILHPRAEIRLKVNKKLVAPRIVTHILVFLLVYIFVFITGSLLLTLLGLDFMTAIGASATCLGNVGPGIGDVGPVNNFSALPDAAKYILSVLMIFGRLELFTVMILFTSYFWRDN